MTGPNTPPAKPHTNTRPPQSCYSDATNHAPRLTSRASLIGMGWGRKATQCNVHHLPFHTYIQDTAHLSRKAQTESEKERQERDTRYTNQSHFKRMPIRNPSYSPCVCTHATSPLPFPSFPPRAHTTHPSPPISVPVNQPIHICPSTQPHSKSTPKKQQKPYNHDPAHQGVRVDEHSPRIFPTNTKTR